MTIEEFLQKLPAVMAVLTSEKTKERLSDNFEGVSEAVNVAMEASQDAAQDIVSILEEVLDAAYSTKIGIASRNVSTVRDEERLARVRGLFVDVDPPPSY